MFNSSTNVYTGAVNFDTMFADRVMESIAAGIRMHFNVNVEAYLKDEKKTPTMFYYIIMPIHYRWINEKNYLSFLYKAYPEKPPGDEFKIFLYNHQRGWNALETRSIMVSSEDLLRFMYPPSTSSPPPLPTFTDEPSKSSFTPKTRRFETLGNSGGHVKIHASSSSSSLGEGGKDKPISLVSSTDSSTVIESVNTTETPDSIQSAREYERTKRGKREKQQDERKHEVISKFIKKCVRCPDKREFLIHNIISMKMVYLAFIAWKNEYDDVEDISERDFANNFWGIASSMRNDLPFFEEYKENTVGRPTLLVNRKLRGIHLYVNGVRFPEKHWHKKQIANQLLRPVSKQYNTEKPSKPTYLKEIMFPGKRDREEEEDEEEELVPPRKHKAVSDSTSDSSSSFSNLSESSEEEE